jgi:signal transduction histidine kinase
VRPSRTASGPSEGGPKTFLAGSAYGVRSLARRADDLLDQRNYASRMTVADAVVRRVRQAPPFLIDGAIAAWILVVQSAGIIFGWVYWHDPRRVGPFVLLALATVGVILRRRSPWLAYALVWLALASGLVLKTSVAGFAMLVLLYTVAERSSLEVSLLALIAALAADYVAAWPEETLAGFRFLGLGVAQLVITNWAWLSLAWFAGRMQARRRAVASDLQRTVDVIKREQGRLARSAIGIERARIARELHTLVLHGIEEMQMRTRIARRHLGDAASQVSSSIADIEAIGRRTLIEMRRLLLILRADHRPGESTDGGSPPEAPARSSSSTAPRLGAPADSADRVPSFGTEFGHRWIDIPWVTDALILVLMATLAVAEPLIVGLWLCRDGGDPSAWPCLFNTRVYIPVAAALVGVFVFRRKAPLLVLAVVGSIIFAQSLFGSEYFVADRAIFVAVFTVSALRGSRWGWIALGVAVAAFAPQLRDPHNFWWEPWWASQMAFAVIAGIAVRERQRLNGELGEQMETLRRTREERLRRAVDEERTRIARDAHDMVAHGVTLMVIQAGAARWLSEVDPVRAERALDSVDRAGRQALRELNSLVGTLQPSSVDGAEPLPAPDHLGIPELVEQAIGEGMAVEMVTRGEPRELGAGLEVSLYRIVQEALTNVRKHAPGARVWVELSYSPDRVDVEVTDTGGARENGEGSMVPGAGQGLVGIAERTALFEGSLEAGPTPVGGFRVHASLAGERVPV